MKKPRMETKHSFSHAGDKLGELNSALLHWDKRLDEAREELKAKELELKPYRDQLSFVEGRRANVMCRLNAWWNAFRRREKAKR
jgi:hypothetical protein